MFPACAGNTPEASRDRSLGTLGRKISPPSEIDASIKTMKGSSAISVSGQQASLGGHDFAVSAVAGSAAFSIACAARTRAKEFWLNDYNKLLADLVGLIINQPEYVADFYRDTWRSEEDDALEHYYRVREDFNRTNNPKLLLYLLARCVKGSVRYNSEGLFNQSPDKRRLGTRPETMRENIVAVSMLMRGKTIVTTQDYRDVLANCRDSDVIYMGPPYQGVCGERDSRYLSGISFDDFVIALDQLNARGVRYLISYDGRLGEQTYGHNPSLIT